MMGTLGGNDAFLGDIARACIYKLVPPGGWGLPYDEDPNSEGYCKINLAKSRAYINNATGLPKLFNTTLNNIFAFKREPGQLVPRFDLYVVAYVQFFNATTEPCNG
jgi:hypothetical protein